MFLFFVGHFEASRTKKTPWTILSVANCVTFKLELELTKWPVNLWTLKQKTPNTRQKHFSLSTNKQKTFSLCHSSSSWSSPPKPLPTDSRLTSFYSNHDLSETLEHSLVFQTVLFGDNPTAKAYHFQILMMMTNFKRRRKKNHINFAMLEWIGE